MKLFEEMEKREHEELIFSYFEEVGLKLIISLHDTTPGKAVGGLRMNHLYKSDMNAIIESLRLSRSMSFQSATADLDSGGGNALLVGDSKRDKNEAYFRALGRFIESLKGRLIIYPDMGTDVQDFKYIQRETNYTIFEKDLNDGSRPTSLITACGVYWGIKACAKKLFGVDTLAGRSFAVQGLGEVGRTLVDMLLKDGATLYVSDLVYDNIKEVEDLNPEVEINILSPEDILFQEVDFLVPCAVGFIIDREKLQRLKCKAIAGAAYTIFTEEELIEEVYRRGILYAPALVISAGDFFLLNRNLKLRDVEKGQEKEMTRIIYDIMLNILDRAAGQGISPYRVAVKDAVERIKKIGQIKNILC